MIRFETTGVLTNIARGTQITTEWSRADAAERLADGKKLYTVSGGWEEPIRYGFCGVGHLGQEQTRHTTLRLQTEGDESQKADFWVTEKNVGKAMFERLLTLEVGARVKLTGCLRHENSYFRPAVLRVRILGAGS